MFETDRLLLRKPTAGDAEAIFRRYSADPEVTRYMSWATHRRLDDTRAFLAWSEGDWARWPAGSYLVFARDQDCLLIGGTGVSFRTPDEAVTGYVLARDAWGKGYATECLRAMILLARQTGVRRLEAVCHAENRASAHVMEKCGMHYEGLLAAHTEFPNLQPGVRLDVLRYGLELEGDVDRASDAKD
ncbi:MAG TPA: GNAT family N-acetyltransferase [Terracidiphilus sp.]|nr:GNAT family N-acetyltransferase [Terracidiphilus sp.]